MNLNNSQLFKLIQELEELLKRVENLCGRVKHLCQEIERESTSETYSNNSSYQKLLEYGVLFEDNSFWESRQDYLKLTELFLNGTINGDQFSNQIEILRSKDIKTAKLQQENLKTKTDFQFTSKSIGFSEVISHLYSGTESFDSSLEDSESSIYGLSENGLKNFIQEYILLKIQKYCDET